MGEFTKGPWLRSGKTVYALNPRNFNRFCAQVQDAHTPDDELIANAVLMQSAPDLLEALESMCAEFRALDLPYGSEAYRVANALINRVRARGIEE